MKKLIALIIVAATIYYFVLSNNEEAIVDGTVKKMQPEDRALNYDIKYKEAVDKIDKAVELNLKKIESMDKNQEEVISEANKKSLEELEGNKVQPEDED